MTNTVVYLYIYNIKLYTVNQSRLLGKFWADGSTRFKVKGLLESLQLTLKGHVWGRFHIYHVK